MPYYDLANLVVIVEHKYLNKTNIINEMACSNETLGTTAGRIQY